MSRLLLPFVTVAQQHRAIVERLGKFHKVLEPGLNFKFPFIDRVAYEHSLKEDLLNIDQQTAITKDNVKIQISGVLYYKVTDAKKAAYEVCEPFKAMSLLAQTSMRSEIGLLELDRTFRERDTLNTNIKRALNSAGDGWGIEVLRYEIKDIKPPVEI
jgi:regulator of protease activity HflC (stomatin/prohibitin superfamily)